MMLRAALPGMLLACLLAWCGQAAAGTLEARVAGPGGRAVADAAVVLEPLAPAHAAAHPGAHPGTHATIEQRGTEFIPWVSVVQTGTLVDFPNNDTTRHHVYSFSQPKRFEIKLYVGKPSKPVLFDQPGEVVIGCNIHDWMEAYVLVVDSPWFARTAADGRASIANVPTGRYRVRLWHPLQKSEAPAQEIEIGAAPLHLALALDVKPREPRPHTDVDPDHY
jgi:plastocyanin